MFLGRHRDFRTLHGTRTARYMANISDEEGVFEDMNAKAHHDSLSPAIYNTSYNKFHFEKD